MQTYDPPVSAWLPARRLVKVGPALLLGAIATGSFLLFFGEFVGGISSVLIVAIPLLVILTLFGFIVTLIGAVGWALQASIRRLVWLGIALTILGVVCFFVGEKIQFGFDDPSVLFMQAITFSPLVVGVLFLLSAGIRRLRVLTRTSKSEE
jgi:hypothetical protein